MVEIEGSKKKFHELKLLIESLEYRIEALEKVVKTGNVDLKVEVPRVIFEKKPLDIRISEEELPGRIILLVKGGFFDEGKTNSQIASELMRRCWHPKNLKHIRPTLEHLTALGVLNRTKERRKRGEGFKWVYKKGGDLKILEEALPQNSTLD